MEDTDNWAFVLPVKCAGSVPYSPCSVDCVPQNCKHLPPGLRFFDVATKLLLNVVHQSFTKMC